MVDSTYRIGLIAYALERAPGGIGRYTRELLASLDGEDISLTVLRAGRGELPGEVLDLPGAGYLPGLLSLGQFEIGWLARRWGLDLVHDPTGSLPLMLASIPRVATIHDVIPFIYPRTSATLDWLIYRAWLPLIAPRLDGLITVSEQSRVDIIHFLDVEAEKVFVIPEAANSNYRPMTEVEILPALKRAGVERPYILYVGSIEPRKNLIRLLEAYARLREWSARWNLVVVGARNFWKSTPVVETVEELGLKLYVVFTGFIPEEDLPAIYNGADLVAFPSLYEGFGLPVVEAMACGIPVVTSDVSSLPEVAGEAALLVDPYNVEEIAEAMMRVLSDPDLAGELREKGLAHAAQFTWERTARETVAVYKKVLGASKL